MKNLIKECCRILAFIVTTLFSYNSIAQIGINTTSPFTRSAVEIKSPNKGFILPRMTTAERLNIIKDTDNASIKDSAKSMIVYDLDKKSFWSYDGTAWLEIDAYSNAIRRSGQDPQEVANETMAQAGFLAKDYDGNYYKTKKYGSKRWMVEDLKTDHDNNGLQYSWTTPYDKVFYDQIPIPKTVRTYSPYYGGGVCPVGWHIPSKAEWELLFTTIYPSWNTNLTGLFEALCDSFWYDWTTGPGLTSVNNIAKSYIGNNSSGFSCMASNYYMILSTINRDYYNSVTFYVTSDWVSGLDQIYVMIRPQGMDLQFIPLNVTSSFGVVRCVKD